ncbi:hypothetical protein GGS20DRAFT_584930 [Poronia punctata]|nr:hypothetical protein GGS20DRAFT_584930 [Poronia punctata]
MSSSSSSSLTPPVPIVLVGIGTEIGGPVIEGLRPEWDGSENYGRPVRAVLFGRAFSKEQVETLREECDSVGGKEPVLWVAAGDGREGRTGRGGPPPGAEKIVLPLFRKCLDDWKRSGDEKGGMVLY